MDPITLFTIISGAASLTAFLKELSENDPERLKRMELEDLRAELVEKQLETALKELDTILSFIKENNAGIKVLNVKADKLLKLVENELLNSTISTTNSKEPLPELIPPQIQFAPHIYVGELGKSAKFRGLYADVIFGLKNSGETALREFTYHVIPDRNIFEKHPVEKAMVNFKGLPEDGVDTFSINEQEVGRIEIGRSKKLFVGRITLTQKNIKEALQMRVKVIATYDDTHCEKEFKLGDYFIYMDKSLTYDDFTE